ncbi:MAG: Rpn family recombination-promoting nuclease/putative transposase, partial [Bacteroidetes bacterium]|nr:Rpn family recombination-promoting nuclease/putative transposase [Bacteroidota bacterium]
MNKKHIRFDWAVKKILRSKANFGILEGFLSELLKEDIIIEEILESESNKDNENDKINRVDFLIKNKKGELIIAEIQNTKELDYFLRLLFSTSKVITEHIREGSPYKEIKKVISVSIVYFDLGQGEDYIYQGKTIFRGLHNNDILQLSHDQKELFQKANVSDLFPDYYIIKVNQFDDTAKDTLDEWIYFFKNSEIKEEFNAKGLAEARKVLQEINLSDDDLREYKRYKERLMDEASYALTLKFEAEQ